MARNTLRDMLVDYYFPRQGIIEYAMTPGQQAGQNQLARLGGGPGGGENTGGAVTMPNFRYGGFEQAPEAPPAEGGGGGLTLPEIIQQYFPDSDFTSGGAGQGGGGGGQGGMGRGPGSHAPDVASQGFGNDVAAAFDAFSGNFGPFGMMDTLAGLAFADNPNDMPSAWGAFLDAIGLGDDNSDRSGGWGNNAPTGGMTTVDPNTGAPQSTNPALNGPTIAGVNLGNFGIGVPTSSYGQMSTPGGGGSGGGGGGRGSNAGSNAGRGGAGPSGKSGPGGNRR